MALSSNERFYLQPVVTNKPIELLQYWYLPKPLGEKKIKAMVSNMFSDISIDGHFTNHSLRMTGTSELFAAGVPEALIQKCVGHRSLESLRLYETRGVQDEFNQTISNILAGENKSFTQEYQLVRDAMTTTPHTPDTFKMPNASVANDSGFVDDFDLSDEDYIEKYCAELETPN